MKKIKSLIEYYAASQRDYNTKINDPEAYKFANGILLELCMKYTKWAFNCKTKITPIKSRDDSGLHRAAFNVTLISLDSDKSFDKHKILCKIYKTDKENNTIAIDYNAIVGGYYDIIASIIDGTVYYLSLYDIYSYQERMGNRCITKGGKYIEIDANYFMQHARAEAPMEQEDITRYNNEYKNFIMKSTSTFNRPRRLVRIGESRKFNTKSVRQLLEGIRSITGINNRSFDKKVLHIINEYYEPDAADIKPELLKWCDEHDPDDYESICEFVALQLDVEYIAEYLANEFGISTDEMVNVLLAPDMEEVRWWISDVCCCGQYENPVNTHDGFPTAEAVRKALRVGR